MQPHMPGSRLLSLPVDWGLGDSARRPTARFAEPSKQNVVAAAAFASAASAGSAAAPSVLLTSDNGPATLPVAATAVLAAAALPVARRARKRRVVALQKSATGLAVSRGMFGGCSRCGPNTRCPHGKTSMGDQRGNVAHQFGQKLRIGKSGKESTPSGTNKTREHTANSEKASEARKRFDWSRAWYPLAVVEDLDPGRPTRLELLGEDLVAWRDGTGTWRVFDDRCPHRSVPLSEGRIEEDGTLLCSYHGWRFNGDGRVVDLPQLQSEAWQRLQQHPRACAAARPAQVRHGLLWVWGRSSEDAALESALVEPTVVSELEDPAFAGRAVDFVWQHRDLPYGWESAVENVVDASHVAVTHHNMISNRYTDPSPIEVLWERRPTSLGGFKFQMKNLRPKKGKEGYMSTTEFRPPCMVHNRATAPSGASTTLLLYFSPTKPGRCRLLVSFMLVSSEGGDEAPAAMPNARSQGVELRQAAFAFLQSPLLPRWLVHVVAPLFLHQDLVFLHRQQAILQRNELGTGQSWRSMWWTPAQTDTGSIALRRWLEANGGIGWSPTASSASPLFADNAKAQLFDTYRSHTEHCVSCQRALRNFSIAEKAFGTLGTCFVAAAAGAAGAGGSHGAMDPLPLLASGVLLGSSSLACGAIRELFHEYRYEAQDND